MHCQLILRLRPGHDAQRRPNGLHVARLGKGSIQRVVLVASMAEGLVLDAAVDLVEILVRELDQMERICDLGRGREHRDQRETPWRDRSSIAHAIASSHLWSLLASHSQALTNSALR